MEMTQRSHFRLRPFFSYYGAKFRAAKHYPKPLFGTIIEPFAGAAGYATHYADRDVILIEKNPKIAAIWRYLIATPAQEILELPLLPQNGVISELNICQSAKWLIGMWSNQASVNPRLRASGWAKKYNFSDSYWGAPTRAMLARQVEMIRHWKVIEGDYADAPNIEATWFIDPPYTVGGKHYPFNNIDYAALAEWCNLRSGQVMVCEAAGATWLPFKPFREIQTNQAKGPGVSKEVLWLKT